MNIAIIGPGAIGQFLAHCLDYLPVTIYNHRNIYEQKKLTLNKLDMTVSTINAQFSPINNFKYADLVLVATKAHQVKEVLNLLPKNLESPIILFNNGILDYKNLPFSQNIAICITTHGVIKNSDYTITHTGQGKFTVDKATFDNNPNFKDIFISKLKAEFIFDITKALWQKLIVNAVINPLTAIYNCKNGELHKIDNFHDTVNKIISEIIKVATATEVLLDFSEMRNNLYLILNKTSANYSSMHQDLLYRRPTEIDAINGYIVKLGSQLNIKTPMNSMLTTKIKDLENAK